MKRTVITILAVAAMVALGLPANAADITMSGDDTGSDSSFAAGTNWTGAAAPTLGNNYFTGAYTLQGSTTTSQTFAGDALTVGPGGQLTIFAVPYTAYDQGTILPKLYLDGCTIVNGATSGTSQIRAYAGTGYEPLTLAEQQKMFLDGDVVLDSSGGGTLQVAAQFVGVGGVTIKGNVSYFYTPLNGYHHVHEYAGDTTIESGGTLSLSYCYMPYGAGKGDVIADGTFTPFRTSNINGLYGSGVVNASPLVVGNGDADGDFSGKIQGGALTKTGAGTQILSGANTYTGGTQVNGGVLLVNNLTGSGTGTGAVAVNSGGTLGGTGFLSGAVTVAGGGFLSPGASVGTLTIDDNLDISGALGGAPGSMLFEFDGASGDMISLTGGGVLTIGSGLLEWDDFVFTGTAAKGTYTLFDTSASIVGTLGTTLTGTIGGVEATLSLDASGNDLVLEVIPEPATMSLLLIGGIGALLRRRRREA